MNERDFYFIQSLASDRKKDIDRRSHRPEWHVSEVLSTGDCPKTIRRFKLIQKEPKPKRGLLITGRRNSCMWKKGNPPFRNSIGDLQQLHQGKSGHPFLYYFLFDFGLRLEALAWRKTRYWSQTHCFVPRGWAFSFPTVTSIKMQTSPLGEVYLLGDGSGTENLSMGFIFCLLNHIKFDYLIHRLLYFPDNQKAFIEVRHSFFR